MSKNFINYLDGNGLLTQFFDLSNSWFGLYIEDDEDGHLIDFTNKTDFFDYLIKTRQKTGKNEFYFGVSLGLDHPKLINQFSGRGEFVIRVDPVIDNSLFEFNYAVSSRYKGFEVQLDSIHDLYIYDCISEKNVLEANCIYMPIPPYLSDKLISKLRL